MANMKLTSKTPKTSKVVASKATAPEATAPVAAPAPAPAPVPVVTTAPAAAPVVKVSQSDIAAALATLYPPLSLNESGYIPGVASNHSPKRATIAQFSTVELTGKPHPGKGCRIRRWDNLLNALKATKDSGGLTIFQCMSTVGLDHLDVFFWQGEGLVRVTPPTASMMERGTKEAMRLQTLKPTPGTK